MQTAVEFLISKIASKIDNEYWSNQQDITECVEQAKEMEKQMVIDIVEKSRATGLTAEYLLLIYGSKGSDEIKTDKI